MKRTALALVAALFAFAGHAGQYFQDFTSMAVGSISFSDGSDINGIQFGTNPPAMGVQDGNYKEFQLTANGAPLTHSALIMRDLDPGMAVYAFSVRWNSQVYRTSTNDGEGFSFNFGQLTNLPINVGSHLYAQESGYPTGLCFSVQTSATNNPGFYLRVNGSTLTALPYNPQTQWGLLNGTRHLFEVDWRHGAGLTVRMDGQTIFTNVATPGFIPQVGDRFVWAARTGDFSQQVRLDNIVIATGGNLVAVPMGGPFYKSGEFPSATTDKAFDGIVATKWLTTAKTGYVGATCVFGRENIFAYSLTVAEDIQGRDPSIWKLEGSNNGGTNWTACGDGAGFFLNRNETRSWVATNASAFGAFRLNISTNRGSAEIQLSELRLYRFVPALAISRSGNKVILQWANHAPDFYLEDRTNLSTGGWSSNSISPTLNGSVYSVTNLIDAPAKFFRLRRR